MRGDRTLAHNMKPLVFLISLLFTTTVFAQTHRKVGESDPLPSAGFKSFAELNSWATTSSFGGGGSQELTLSGKKVFYSLRSVTSGMPTSELILYSLNAKDEIHPFIIVPVQGVEFSVKVEEGEIVVRKYDRMKKKWPIAARITPLMLPN